MKAPKLESPSFSNYDFNIMHSTSPRDNRHAIYYVDMFASWAFLEHGTTSAIHHLLGDGDPAITGTLLGTLEFKSRFEKLQQIIKLRGGSSEIRAKLEEFKLGINTPRKIRNLMSHLPVTGWDKNDLNTFYLLPFHATALSPAKGRIIAYKLNYQDVKKAADYASFVGKSLYPLVKTMPLPK